MFHKMIIKYAYILLLILITNKIQAIATSVALNISGDPAGENKVIYAFTESGTYTTKSAITDFNSVASFDLNPGSYKFRFTEDGQQWFSQTVLAGTHDAIISVPAYSEFLILADGENVGAGVQGHFFHESGAYSGIFASTNEHSQISRRLAPGNYRLRTSWQGKHFFSEIFSAPLQSPLLISVPKPTLVTIQLYDQLLTESSKVYAFTEAGVYTGIQASANSSGTASFALVNGTYKFRFTAPDGQNRFTEVFTTTEQNREFSWAGLYPYAIQILFNEASESGPIDLPVYVFNSSGGTNTYAGYSLVTDFNARAIFWLPNADYSFRYPWHGLDVFTPVYSIGGSYSVTLPPLTQVEVVDGVSIPSIEGLIYMYSEDGRYLGLQRQPDSLGRAIFPSPHHETRLKFAVDFDGARWYSASVDAGSTTAILLPPLVQFRITQNQEPVQYGKKLYLFKSDGTYTNRQLEVFIDGLAELRIPDGTFKLRYDSEGTSVYSSDFTVPAESTVAWDIPPLSSVQVKRNNKGYGGGKQVYAFSQAGTYLGQAKVLGKNGIAEFLLSTHEMVKFRFTEDGRHFFSDNILLGGSANLVIPAVTTVCFSINGTIPSGSMVHVFNATSAYTGIGKSLLPSGCQDFVLDSGQYKFRLTHGGTQYYSNLLSAQESHTVLIGEDLPEMAFLDLNLLSQDISYSTSPYLQGKLQWGHGALVSACGISQTLPLTGPRELEFHLNFHMEPDSALNCFLSAVRDSEALSQPIQILHSSGIPEISYLNPALGNTVDNPLQQIQGSFDGFVGEILCSQGENVYLPLTHNGKEFTCQNPVVHNGQLLASIQIFNPEFRSYDLQYSANEPPNPKISRMQWENGSFTPAPNPYSSPQNLSVTFDSDGPGSLGFLIRAVNGEVVYTHPVPIYIPSSGRHTTNLWNGYFEDTPAWEGKWILELFLSNTGGSSYLEQKTVKIWY